MQTLRNIKNLIESSHPEAVIFEFDKYVYKFIKPLNDKFMLNIFNDGELNLMVIFDEVLVCEYNENLRFYNHNTLILIWHDCQKFKMRPTEI